MASMVSSLKEIMTCTAATWILYLFCKSDAVNWKIMQLKGNNDFVHKLEYFVVLLVSVLIFLLLLILFLSIRAYVAP